MRILKEYEKPMISSLGLYSGKGENPEVQKYGPYVKIGGIICKSVLL